MLVLTPACGRDYPSAKKAAWDFNAVKDFIINNFNHPYEGKPVNRGQLIGLESAVKLRFSRNRKVTMVKIDPKR